MRTNYDKYVGQTFGNLKVLEILPRSTLIHKVKAICRCKCGNEKPLEIYRVIHGYVTDCGCSKTMIKDYTPYVGKKFNRLTVLEVLPREHYERGGIKPVKVRCKCECGRERVIMLQKILAGITKSCGCLRGRPCGTVKELKQNGLTCKGEKKK